MYMLVLQTFLLMLAAFLVGCMCACLFKRSLNRFATADGPEEVLHVDVPPATPRVSTEVPIPPRPAVPVSSDEMQRFERALTGDVAAPPSNVATAPSGPMIEVQAPPAPPADHNREDTGAGLAAAAAAAAAAAVAAGQSASAKSNWTRVEVDVSRRDVPAADPAASEDDDGASYAAIAVASHDGSMLPPPGVIEAQLPPPQMPEPAPAPQPVPLVDVPAAVRPTDAPDGPDPSYVAETVAAGIEYIPQSDEPPQDYDLPEVTDDFSLPPEGETYASIATGADDDTRHAGSDDLPKADLPASVRPEDAPDGPNPTYVAETVAAGIEYVPVPDAAPQEFDIPAVTDTYALPPEGETYASIATGGSGDDAADADIEPRGYETKSTHATTALAAAAGLAAQRASTHAESAGDDLTRIKGIDEVLASRLNFAGVTRFIEIASWNADDVRRMSQTLGFFGRVEDEYWIGQARLLAGGPDALPDGVDLVDDTPATVSHATPAAAADIATAAAAAAAAAMVSQSYRPRDDEAAPLAADDAEGDEPPHMSRSDLAGLRSVRSEGLRGDDVDYARSGLDDLKRIRGIGVLIEKKLNSLGIVSYEQVANWSASDIERISDLLDFKGRIERENWIEQARILASGGQTEFSRRVDRGEV